MKHSIEWHIECLGNMKHSRDFLLKRLERIKCEIEQENRAIFIYEQQIKRADVSNVKEFDREKF